MKIFELGYTPFAPIILATPSHDQFCGEVIGNIKTFPETGIIPPMQLRDPEQKAQGFFSLSDSLIAFNQDAFNGPLGYSLGMAGNIHKTVLNDTGEALYVLNVTAIYNCLDRSKTVFYKRRGEELGVDHKLGIKSPAFFSDLIGDSWIFKIPQRMHAIYIASDGRGLTEDFYTLYQQSGMQELKFKQVQG